MATTPETPATPAKGAHTPLPTSQTLLANARARVQAAGGPGLEELTCRFAGWVGPEVSGRIGNER